MVRYGNFSFVTFPTKLSESVHTLQFTGSQVQPGNAGFGGSADGSRNTPYNYIATGVLAILLTGVATIFIPPGAAKVKPRRTGFNGRLSILDTLYCDKI